MSTSAKKPILLVIANQSEIATCGLTNSLADFPDIAIVGAAHSIPELLLLLKTTKADVLLLDIGDERDHLHLLQTLSIQYPNLHVLLFCSVLKPYIAYQLLRFGVTGILSWNIPQTEIYESIQAVAQGRVVLKHENVSGSLIFYFREGLNQLTEKELNTLTYVAAGHTNREIAEQLHVAPRTVETYIAGICAKLNARSRTQAAVQAIQLGLIHM